MTSQTFYGAVNPSKSGKSQNKNQYRMVIKNLSVLIFLIGKFISNQKHPNLKESTQMGTIPKTGNNDTN